MTAGAARRELGMSPRGKALEITLICIFFILIALWGIIWDISSGLLSSGIDGIMLLCVCAMMAGIFFLIALVHLNQTGVIPTPAFLQAKAKPAAAAKAPATAAAPATTAGKAQAAAPVAPKPAAPAAAGPAASPAPARPAGAAPAAPAAVPPTVPPPAAPKVPEE
jgi:predicted lipid-binding transport protein (Tim44 family)